jgi:hypothetical protein
MVVYFYDILDGMAPIDGWKQKQCTILRIEPPVSAIVEEKSIYFDDGSMEVSMDGKSELSIPSRWKHGIDSSGRNHSILRRKCTRSYVEFSFYFISTIDSTKDSSSGSLFGYIRSMPACGNHSGLWEPCRIGFAVELT